MFHLSLEHHFWQYYTHLAEGNMERLVPAQGCPVELRLSDSKSWALSSSLPARGWEGRKDGEVKHEGDLSHIL